MGSLEVRDALLASGPGWSYLGISPGWTIGHQTEFARAALGDQTVALVLENVPYRPPWIHFLPGTTLPGSNTWSHHHDPLRPFLFVGSMSFWKQGASAENDRPVRNEPWWAEMCWQQHIFLCAGQVTEIAKWRKFATARQPTKTPSKTCKCIPVNTWFVFVHWSRKNRLHAYHHRIGIMHELPIFDVTSTFAYDVWFHEGNWRCWIAVAIPDPGKLSAGGSCRWVLERYKDAEWGKNKTTRKSTSCRVQQCLPQVCKQKESEWFHWALARVNVTASLPVWSSKGMPHCIGEPVGAGCKQGSGKVRLLSGKLLW